MYWLQFIISSAVIIAAGVHLTKYADRLSAQLKLGKAMVGVILLGFITSLPEAITCIVAVFSLNADDLAVGNLLGSNNFNPLLVVVMDMVYRREAVTNTVIPRQSLMYSAMFSVAMTVVIIAEIFLNISVHWGPFSIGGILIVLLYIVGMRKVAGFSVQEHKDEPEEEDEDIPGTLVNTWIHIVIGAIVVVASAMVLASSADTLAEQTGLGRTFVGSIFLAIVTSLPEVVVTLSALKMGSIDLAIGNIFGSNMTNSLFIVLCSMVNPQGPVLFEVSNTHILTATMSILLVLVAMAGIKQNKKPVVAGMAWDTWVMLGVFITGTALLYIYR